MLWLLFGVTLVLGEGVVEENSNIVVIKQGPVRGYKVAGTNVFAYHNIPYATAPTGPNKFKAPLPPPEWTEVYDAIDKQVTCPQSWPTVNPKEDCLIASVFAPENRTNLPVLVYVHGGAFQIGSGNYATKFGINSISELIVVNFNYRLGVHGFLCLGTKEAPGNAGMKDQLALLRWVHDNIAAFGGNADDVTIMGCSAGGASVDLLRLASVTEGLFKKVIAESGANAGAFGIQHNPIENAKYYAKALGFENIDDLSALSNFYTSASLETLFSRSDLVSNRPDSSVIFAPCVEKDIGIEMFLDDAPVNILKSGSNNAHPVLYGFANLEGVMRLGHFQNWSMRMNENFSEFLPADLAFENVEEKEAVAKRVKEFYFGDKPVSPDTIQAYVDYFSDTLFVYSILRSVKLSTESGNNSTIYLYEYSFADINSIALPGGMTGALHCDQIQASFDRNEIFFTEERRNIMAKMRRMYSDFITTGSPVSEDSLLPPWSPTNANRDPYMAMGVNISVQGPLYEERANLWDDIYGKYYRAPIPPGNSAKILSINKLLWIMYIIVLIPNLSVLLRKATITI
ncbi:unnamed protein product [Diatraea saccharalis]|uniref:Carboxylic ester hydrolase n=1 Tax=Diatraea saccharalis TaxID=40085 RepID=A0A9N9N373_9NEOP|nr:unnamed protein product [Diatraea saccharalis]